jgi:hypothetical protein
LTAVNCTEQSTKRLTTYLQCPARLTIQLLKKFIRLKFGLCPELWIEIIDIKSDICIPDDYSMIDVAYVFPSHEIGKLQLRFVVILLANAVNNKTVSQMNTTAVVAPPVKRKRGRPRKERPTPVQEKAVDQYSPLVSDRCHISDRNLSAVGKLCSETSIVERCGMTERTVSNTTVPATDGSVVATVAMPYITSSPTKSAHSRLDVQLDRRSEMTSSHLHGETTAVMDSDSYAVGEMRSSLSVGRGESGFSVNSPDAARSVSCQLAPPLMFLNPLDGTCCPSEMLSFPPMADCSSVDYSKFLYGGSSVGYPGVGFPGVQLVGLFAAPMCMTDCSSADFDRDGASLCTAGLFDPSNVVSAAMGSLHGCLVPPPGGCRWPVPAAYDECLMRASSEHSFAHVFRHPAAECFSFSQEYLEPMPHEPVIVPSQSFPAVTTSSLMVPNGKTGSTTATDAATVTSTSSELQRPILLVDSCLAQVNECSRAVENSVRYKQCQVRMTAMTDASVPMLNAGCSCTTDCTVGCVCSELPRGCHDVIGVRPDMASDTPRSCATPSTMLRWHTVQPPAVGTGQLDSTELQSLSGMFGCPSKDTMESLDPSQNVNKLCDRLSAQSCFAVGNPVDSRNEILVELRKKFDCQSTSSVDSTEPPPAKKANLSASTTLLSVSCHGLPIVSVPSPTTFLAAAMMSAEAAATTDDDIASTARDTTDSAPCVGHDAMAVDEYEISHVRHSPAATVLSSSS